CNELVLVVRPGSAVKTFSDLAKAESVVVGAPEVPIGAYTAEILKKAAKRYGPEFERRVQEHIVSRELNVRQVLAKVTLGEADAGIVYRTDALAAKGKATAIVIPSDLNVTAEYPIAALKAAPQPALAKAWIDLVISAAGKKVLADFGFSACPKN
ncbi:MAG: molybdate ABC transporter substrate-binding protein, partial [Deltaproteobacteria bacterium]|nr:molybdate ABC transporter substrate-binding protein [Deltaproteobacteria bacterium]